jgi:very-short-patch-repair endonuclease
MTDYPLIKIPYALKKVTSRKSFVIDVPEELSSQTNKNVAPSNLKDSKPHFPPHIVSFNRRCFLVLLLLVLCRLTHFEFIYPTISLFAPCIFSYLVLGFFIVTPDTQNVEEQSEDQLPHQQVEEVLVSNPQRTITKVDLFALKQFTMYLDPKLINQPARAGAYDKYLRDELNMTFFNDFVIHYDKRIDTHRGYAPDVIIHDRQTGLWIDIEVDEPWHRRGNSPPIPSHYIGKDDKRDEQLRGNGWVIIRFAESQIQEDIAGCLLTIAEFIDLYRQSSSLSLKVKQRFPCASRLQKVPCWTEEEAIQIERSFDREILD